MNAKSLPRLTAAAVFLEGLSALAALAQSPLAQGTERVCPAAPPGQMACFALRRTGVPRAELPSGALTAPAGFSPSDLQDAYKFDPTQGADSTLAVVAAMDAPNAEADLAVYRAQFGLSPCTTANGCFRKINQNGAASPLPAFDSGWASTINLSVQLASAVCPRCKILLVEAVSATIFNLGAAVNQAAAQGASVICNSYGGFENSMTGAECDLYYKHPGIAVVASAGSQGYGNVYEPAVCPMVTAVGGTSLAKAPATQRGWTETVWGSADNANGGTSGGCSGFVPKPAFQTDAGCARRTVADMAAVADPNTGVAVYDQGQWFVYGGTGAAASVVAGMSALASPPRPGDFPVSYVYAHPGSFFDVTQGVNGTCGGSYLCTAGVGYDGPSGWGAPNGVAGLEPGQSFQTVTPCRAVDTRLANGPLGGPALPGGSVRTFPIAGACGIPTFARAVAFNVTVTGSSAAGDLRLFPGASALPSTSTINYRAGQTRANDAVVTLGGSGDLSVRCDQAGGSVQLLLDVSGYFQ